MYNTHSGISKYTSSLSYSFVASDISAFWSFTGNIFITIINLMSTYMKYNVATLQLETMVSYMIYINYTNRS
jgi:hypothetical protein